MEIYAFGQDHVPSVTGSFEDPVTRKKIHFWTKPIAKLMEVSVSTYVQAESIATDEAALGILKSIDVVLGGDQISSHDAWSSTRNRDITLLLTHHACNNNPTNSLEVQPSGISTVEAHTAVPLLS